MIKTVKKSQNSNWFMDLLLDETICAGTVAVPREMVRLAGGANKDSGQSRNMSCCCGSPQRRRLSLRRQTRMRADRRI